jgi:hypothetical protein
VGETNTRARNKKARQFQPKGEKKSREISRHKTDPRRHSYTYIQNVLCYPIRCCAIRSLEQRRRFQEEKRQSSVSSGGVVLVLAFFFSRFSFKRARGIGERDGWMRCFFSTLDKTSREKMRDDELLRARSLALSRKEKERSQRRLNRTPFRSFVRSFIHIRSFIFIRSRRRTRSIIGREKSFLCISISSRRL